MIHLDTCVLVEILDNGDRMGDINRVLSNMPANEVLTYSAVTHFEILQAGGLFRLENVHILEHMHLLPVDKSVAEKAAEIYGRYLGGNRRRIPDALIAATALVFREKLWTFDSDFKKIPGLSLLQAK